MVLASETSWLKPEIKRNYNMSRFSNSVKGCRLMCWLRSITALPLLYQHHESTVKILLTRGKRRPSLPRQGRQTTPSRTRGGPCSRPTRRCTVSKASSSNYYYLSLLYTVSGSEIYYVNKWSDRLIVFFQHSCCHSPAHAPVCRWLSLSH